MHVWFTMGEDGKGVLTGQAPIIARVVGTHRRGVYAQAGDWLLVRGLCAEGIKRMLGHVPEPSQPIPVDLQLIPIQTGATKQEPQASRPVAAPASSPYASSSARLSHPMRTVSQSQQPPGSC